MPDSYDAIVVGAGPAGSSVALIMARAGMEVALLERGQYPGSKNMFGGTIYREPTEEIIPAFWQEAPLERPVITDDLWILGEDSAVTVGFTGLRYGKEPYNKFTALRANFDRWLAQKAAAAGVDLQTATLVTDLIYDKTLLGKKQGVRGVKLESGDRLAANIVILAEGVNAFLTKEVGLRSKTPAHTMTHYVKEVLHLPAGKIEERFHLNQGQGAIIGLLGYPTAGAVGKAALFTNKDSVALIVGGYLDQLVSKGLSPYELLWRTKTHPLIKRLLEGSEGIEYSSHLIPKGGYAFIPKLYMDGLLVAGDAAVMISGRRGTDLAMLSGKYAAETAILAKAKNDFSEKILASYNHKLNGSFFMKDIKANKDGLNYYQKHPDSDYLISSTANEIAYQFFTADMLSEKEKRSKILEALKYKQLPSKTAVDIYTAYQHWGVF